MNCVDFVLIGIIILAAAIAVLRLISNRRRGKGICSCGICACSDCPVKGKKK